MPSPELIDMLQQPVSMELQVSIQYMWQYVRGAGMKSLPVTSKFREIAIEEMEHAETIAERLDYFDVQATTKPATITIGESLKEMIAIDKEAEEGAIAFYKQIIRKASEEDDFTTRLIFMEILEAEEEHHDTFTKLLE